MDEKKEASNILDEDSDVEEQQEPGEEKPEGEEKEGLSWESSAGEKLEEKEEDFDDLANIPHVSSMNDRSTVPYPTLNRNPEGGKTKKFHLLILVLIGIVIVGSTVYFLKNSFNSPLGGILKEKPSPTPVVTPTPTPSPTPTPVDRATFKISVLNGTSKTGLAASVSAKLKNLRYQTTKVGNATNSSFERTVVRVKPSLLHLAEQLIKDLMPEFDGLSDSTLDLSGSDDGVVILGAR